MSTATCPQQPIRFYRSPYSTRVHPISCDLQDRAMFTDRLLCLRSAKMSRKSFNIVQSKHLPNLTAIKIFAGPGTAGPACEEFDEAQWHSIFEKCLNLKKLRIEGWDGFSTNPVFFIDLRNSDRSLFSSNQLTHLSLKDVKISDLCLQMFSDLSRLHELILTNVEFSGLSSWRILRVALARTSLKVFQFTTKVLQLSVIWSILKAIKLDWLRVDCSGYECRRASEAAFENFTRRVSGYPISAFYLRVGGLHNISGELIDRTSSHFSRLDSRGFRWLT